MKKGILFLSIALVILVAILFALNITTTWPVEGFKADVGLLVNERQKLQFEGERRYNDLARMQTPDANVNPGDVQKAIEQVIPVLSNTDTNTAVPNTSMMKLIHTTLGLNAADNKTLMPGSTTQTGVVSQKIAMCEGLNATTEDECDILGRPEYSECGICHKDGTDSKGNAIRGKGLFISKDDQIRTNEAAELSQGKALYTPTVGTCDPKNFTMAKNHCKHRMNQVMCEKAGAATLNNKCAFCFGGQSAGSSGLIYVGPKLPEFHAYLHLSHPGTVAWPTITGSRSSLSAASSYDKTAKISYVRIPITIKENDAVTIAMNGMPEVWCAWLSDMEEKRIVPIDVGMSPSSITPSEAAHIAGDKRSLRVTRNLSSDPNWSSFSSKVPSNVLWYRRNLSFEPTTVIKFSFNVPATLMDPSPPMNAFSGEGTQWDMISEKEDIVKQCPAGPMIYTEAGSAMMSANSCFKANGAFNPTLHCMQELFLGTGGGTSAGSLFPKTEADAAAMAVNNSLDDTVDYLNNLANIAIYKVDQNGAMVDFKTFKDASMKMLGRVPVNPCDVDRDPANGTIPYSPDCLDYLWRTSGKTGPEPSFTNGVDPATIPYSFCSANGSLAPLKSNGTINSSAKQYNTNVPIDTIRSEYNKIFADAQNSSNFDGQVDYIKKCYGASLSAPGAPEVFNVAPGGYSTSRNAAPNVCLNYGATLATKQQLSNSQAQGADTCSTGWIADDTENAYYPITNSTQSGCGGGRTGLMRWTPGSKLAGVYCFGTKPPKGTTDVGAFNATTWNNPNTQSNPILCPALPMNPKIQQGNKIGVITGTTRNYMITFDLTPLGIVGGWGNILRFTYTDDESYVPGCRVPAIWFTPGTTKLHIRMGDVTSGNWGLDETAPLPMNVTSKVQIRCIDANVKITVGSAETWDSNNGFWPSYDLVQPQQRPDPAGRPLIVYAGDPWFTAANATIANLIYQIIP